MGQNKQTWATLEICLHESGLEAYSGPYIINFSLDPEEPGLGWSWNFPPISLFFLFELQSRLDKGLMAAKRDDVDKKKSVIPPHLKIYISEKNQFLFMKFW